MLGDDRVELCCEWSQGAMHEASRWTHSSVLAGTRAVCFHDLQAAEMLASCFIIFSVLLRTEQAHLSCLASRQVALLHAPKVCLSKAAL